MEVIEVTEREVEIIEVIERGPAGPQGAAGTGLETLTTQGDTLYRGPSTGERLPIGSAGQVLKVVNGLPAWANESGAVTSVNGLTGAVTVAIPSASSSTPQPSGPAAVGSATAYARSDHRHPHYTGIDEDADGLTQQNPQIITVAQSDLPCRIVLFQSNAITWTRVVLPYMSNIEQGNFDTFAARQVDAVVAIRVNGSEAGSSCQLRVVVGDGAVYPASGYDEIEFDRDYIFRWNGNRWDMDIASNNDTISREIFRPAYGCTLAGFVSAPATPTSPGVAGQLAWGYDDGAQRLYICVSNNVWRRTTISTWT